MNAISSSQTPSKLILAEVRFALIVQSLRIEIRSLTNKLVLRKIITPLLFISYLFIYLFLIVRIIFMLGKIYNQGSVAFIFCPIVKTSNSGLFGNRRLAIFATKQAVIGYHSKVPQAIQHYQDINCLQQCKQTIQMRKQNGMMFYIKPEEPSVFVLKWQGDKEKMWEFKFQNEALALEWYRHIDEAINPEVKAEASRKKEIQEEYQKIDFSRLKEPSRFSPVQPVADQQVKNQEQKVEQSQKQEIKIDLYQQKTVMTSQNKLSERFRSFQRKYQIGYDSVNHETPIITTFREKYPNNTIFSSLNKDQVLYNDSADNWNIIWYQAIQTEQQHVRIEIYNNFLRTCQHNCKEIIKEMTLLKSHRKYIPEKITSNEQIYNNDNITFRLNIERDIDDYPNGICTKNYVNVIKTMMENYTFILKATKNKGLIKVPLACVFQYYGFFFFCEANMPSHFIQVDHSEKYLFQPQIQRLQSQLKLRINLAHIDLYTNKISAIVEPSRGKRTHYLIIKDIKGLLPVMINQSSDIFSLSSHFFLHSKEIYPKNYDYIQEKQAWISSFCKNQNLACTIISYEDLLQSLYKNNVAYGMIAEVLYKCDNKYLCRVFVTQMVSQIFCHIVRCEIMSFVKKWNKDLETMITDELPDYETYIFKLLSELLSENTSSDTKIWNVIYSQLFDSYSLIIKTEQIIKGYFLSSISLKLGINLDYQLLLLQKDHFFTQDVLISTETIKSFEPLFIKYSNEEMCDSYQAMMNQIQTSEDERTLENVIKFYRLNTEKERIEPYHWKKICRLFSFFVPYGDENEYSFFQIYSHLSLLYLDYYIYSVMISAIKWLLHSNRVNDALEFANFFKEICWFWLSQSNPFIINIYQILGQYNKITCNYLQSINFFSQCNESLEKLFKGGAELQNLDRNYQLAQIFMTCNMHKDALHKFREVKSIFQKYEKQSSTILDIMVEISKLYLHLGDIDSCLKSCKATIDFSILNPFKDEFQQFELYTLLLRSFEIKEENHKYKFYVDMIEQKFQFTRDPIILQSVLRLTTQQILEKYSTYSLKKTAFILYTFEKYRKQQQQELQLSESYLNLIKSLSNEPPCKILKLCMENSLEISDMMVDSQATTFEILNNSPLLKFQELLMLFCNLIGYEFFLGQIVLNINKKQKM